MKGSRREVLRRIVGASDLRSPDLEGPKSIGVNVEVVAYVDDLLIRGRLQIDASRLTDEVAAATSFRLTQVRATSLRDGVNVRVPQADLPRGDVVALTMAGPSGDPMRRVRRPDRASLALRAGPYRIWGHAHMPPAVDPIAYARHHGPILPLTDVDIAYELRGSAVTEALPGLIVNLDLIDSMVDVSLCPVEAELDAFAHLGARSIGFA
jgi:hypothetical protein